MSLNDTKRDLARLEAVLDAHGANPGRWPAADAERLMGLARSDSQAQRALRDAQALDRVLAVAPAGSPGGLEGLTARIMSEVAAKQPVARVSAEIVPLPIRAVAAKSAMTRRSSWVWQACAAMAAALIVGFYVGGSDLVAPTLQQVAGLSVDEADLAAPAGQPVIDEPQEGELL